MFCKIQVALTEEWYQATQEFSNAIRAMTASKIDTISWADYMLLRDEAEKARLASENARMLLELHRNEHGC
jgi:hypothetical protein